MSHAEQRRIRERRTLLQPCGQGVCHAGRGEDFVRQPQLRSCAIDPGQPYRAQYVIASRALEMRGQPQPEANPIRSEESGPTTRRSSSSSLQSNWPLAGSTDAQPSTSVSPSTPATDNAGIPAAGLVRDVRCTYRSLGDRSARPSRLPPQRRAVPRPSGKFARFARARACNGANLAPSWPRQLGPADKCCVPPCSFEIIKRTVCVATTDPGSEIRGSGSKRDLAR